MRFVSGAFWLLILVGLIVRVVRSRRAAARRGGAQGDADRGDAGSGGGVAKDLLSGADEIQNLYLGRRPMPPVVYGQPVPTVAEVSIQRTDPLDDPVWTIPDQGPNQGPNQGPDQTTDQTTDQREPDDR